MIKLAFSNATFLAVIGMGLFFLNKDPRVTVKRLSKGTHYTKGNHQGHNYFYSYILNTGSFQTECMEGLLADF